MTLRATTLVLLGLTLAFVPTALAETAEEQKSGCPEGQTSTPEGCSTQAWSDGCAPDMMCTFGDAGHDQNGTASDPGNKTQDGNLDDRPTYSGDCGGEMCAYDNDAGNDAGSGDGGTGNGTAYGPDGCIECSGFLQDPPPGTCMDGAEAGEACDDDVQYLGPTDGRGPEDCEFCRGEEEAVGGAGTPDSDDDQQVGRDAPAASTVVALALIGLAAMARRRK